MVQGSNLELRQNLIEAGRFGYFEGRRRGSCPFVLTSMAADWWLEGFDAAEQEYKDE